MTTKEHIQYALICLLAVAFVFLSHEGIHWLTGRILGYDMVMTLNAAYPSNGKYESGIDYQIISLSGPVLTTIIMVVFSLIVVRTKNFWLFPVIFICFYSTLLAGVMNIFNPNDLGRVSRYAGLGLYTLPVAAVIVQFVLMDFAAKRARIHLKLILISVFWGVLFASVWILLDQNIKLKIF